MVVHIVRRSHWCSFAASCLCVWHQLSLISTLGLAKRTQIHNPSPVTTRCGPGSEPTDKEHRPWRKDPPLPRVRKGIAQPDTLATF
jgi:hypothetical protein